MSSRLDFAALEECLKTLNHLYIDIDRLKAEAGYEAKRGGYGDVQVSRLDSGTAGSKLVAAKRIYLKARHKEPERLAFRLARELKVWAKLHHPHVLPVLGYYLDKDYRLAVLMSEYMIHGDLKDYIEQEKPSWDVRLYLVRDTTAGLAYLHGQDPPIRHGDLKTGNVLINAERRAVLADFGLSSTLEDGPTGLTTSDGLKGTLRYYSPEIVAETADCHSLPSDIWAWACLVLEVLADIIPYAGKKSEHSIIKALMNKEPPSDTISLPIPVPAVKDLLTRCWTIQPNERPPADHCLTIIAMELSAQHMNPGVGRDSYHGRNLQSSNLDEDYSSNRPHQDGGWFPAMGSQAGPNPTAIQNRPGTTQSPQDALAVQDGLSWAPATFTLQMAQQLGRERLQAMVNAHGVQQQQQQASALNRVPSTQPLQTSPEVNQQSQPGPSNRQLQFPEFFKEAFNHWLSQRQLTLDPPRVDGKEVELHKLFFLVGALGGCRAVFEKKLWPVVGAKIGFPYFNGSIPYSKPEVAEHLSKIYEKIFAEFEVHWHNSLRPRDPNSIFPLPAQLQYLHPEIERLAQFSLPLARQPQRLSLGAGPQQPPDGNAGRGTPNQMTQQTPHLGQAQAANHQQDALMRNQPDLAFPPQPDPSGQGGPMGGLNNHLPPLSPQLQQLFKNPEVMKLSPEELKRRGVSDDIIQTMVVYRQAWLATEVQNRRERENLLHPAYQVAQQQAANLLNVKKDTPRMAPGNRPPPGLGGAQPPGLGPAVGNSLQPSALPPLIVSGLNVPPKQLAKAQEKVRAVVGFFQNKRDYSSINLSHEQGVLLEQSIQQTRSLLIQVVQNIVAFAVLAPNDDRELSSITQTVVTLSHQTQILQKQPPERRFIFGLGDLNQYRNHLTTFLIRVKGLQSQAMTLQGQQASGALPPGPPPPKPSAINSKFALGKKPVPKHKLPPKRGGPPGEAGAGGVPPLLLSSTEETSLLGFLDKFSGDEFEFGPVKGMPEYPKHLAPGAGGATKPTLKLPPAEVRGISRPEPDRPQSSKREREDDVTGPDGFAGPYGLPKRVRTDPQEDLGAGRAAYLAAGKQVTIEGSLDFLEKMAKEDERVATGVQPEEEGDDWLWAIDSTQWANEDLVVSKTQG